MKAPPYGWCMASIGSICKLKNGRAFKPSEWKTSGLPIVRIQNLNNPDAAFNYFNGDYQPNHYLKGGELLFAWSGTPGTSFGAHIWRNKEAVLNQHIFRVDFDDSILDKRFFRHAINQKLNELIDIAHGGVGLRHVTKGKFESTQILVPPPQEQKRIADRLDTLLARVDACGDRLDRMPLILKRFRQSVLAAATSGQLTVDWRIEKKIVDTERRAQFFVKEPYTHTVEAPSSWKFYTLGELCNFVGGSQPPKTNFIPDEGPDVIRLIQIRDYKSDKYKVYIPRKLARRFCNKTDIMVARYGPPIFQILRGIEGAYNVALMKAEPKIYDIDQNYLYYLLKGDTLLKYVEAGSDRTAGQDGVRKELLYPYPVFLPAMEEQHEIVHRIERLFAFADRLEARITAARNTIDRLTPALLAKAFRGELVAQDPNDEPAIQLLKRMTANHVAALKPEHEKKVA